MMTGHTYSSIDVVGLSGASGITTLCKSMPLFSKDLKRCFFVTPNDQNQALKRRVVLNTDMDSISNLIVFVVSAKKNEFDASMKTIEKYLKISQYHDAANVIVVVNKMDAVKYSEERFKAIKGKMNKVLNQQSILAVIPHSYKGETSVNMKWYDG